MFNNKFTKNDPVADEIAKIMAEEPEQIDELSTSTLGSYTQKAMGQTLRGGKDRTPGMQKAYKKMTTKKTVKSEEVENLDELSKSTLAKYMRANTKRMADPKNPDSMERKMKRHDDYFKASKKFHEDSELAFKDYLIDSYKNSLHDIEQIDEKEMSPAQQKKKEEIVLSMKDKQKEFKAKYGKRWKEVMYATATKMAMKEEVLDEKWDDDDDDVARADRELARMKAKPIKPHEKTDPDKEISKLAKKTPKEVDEEVDLDEGNMSLKHAVMAARASSVQANRRKRINTSGSHNERLDQKKDDLDRAKKSAKKYSEEVETTDESVSKKVDNKPGWMLRADPELGKKISDMQAGRKELQKYAGKSLKKEEVEIEEGKDPNMDAGCGAAPNFVTDGSPMMKKIKAIALSSKNRLKNEMLGKTGTSESVDTNIKTTDMLRGRVKGGRSDEVGPGANFKTTKIRLKDGDSKEENKNG